MIRKILPMAALVTLATLADACDENLQVQSTLINGMENYLVNDTLTLGPNLIVDGDVTATVGQIAIFRGNTTVGGQFGLVIDASACSPPGASLAGIWVGQTGAGLLVQGLVTQDGQVHWLSPQSGETGFGTVSVDGNEFTSVFTDVAPLLLTFIDGSYSASCTSSGEFLERQSVDVDYTCTTTLGYQYGNSASYTYDDIYELGSSLATIAGDYDDSGAILNISDSGVIFGQNPTTGCTINGQADIIDPAHNGYDVSITFSNCPGAFITLNDATFTGIGWFDSTAAPPTLVIGVRGDVQGALQSIVAFLPRI